ncbi:hypothetical protein [Aliiglaciecola aliphaticivorans]
MKVQKSVSVSILILTIMVGVLFWKQEHLSEPISSVDHSSEQKGKKVKLDINNTKPEESIVTDILSNDAPKLDSKVTESNLPDLLVRDESLIAELEEEMQFKEKGEGDFAYMSPENETIQKVGVEFPAVEPEDPIATLGEDAIGLEVLGVPFNEEIEK